MSVYGLGGILSASPDDALVDSAYRHDCEDGRILLPALVSANVAHALVLYRAGVLPGPELRLLLEGLDELSARKASDYHLDPALGDVYNCFDDALESIVGEAAGWLHAGRARREAVNVAFYLSLRSGLIDLAERAFELLDVFVAVSRRHESVLMPDFTYLYHAQPTRLSHYLLTFAHAHLRDVDRLLDCIARVNRSSGESGSVNGSRLPLDREYFARLLGFESVVTHCRDAMWQPDLPFEAVSCCASTMMNQARLAEELQIWSTAEFGMVVLPDKYCRASVIMPQKRNPYPLTYIRGLANQVIGKVSTYGSYGRIPSGNPDSRTFIYGDLVSTVDKVGRALFLFSRLLDDMYFDADRMRAMLDGSDCFATDLADELIGRAGLNYRAAHKIVGRCVAKAGDEGRVLAELTREELRAVASELGFGEIGTERVDLRSVFDAEASVERRCGIGGASRERVQEMLQDISKRSSQGRRRIERVREMIRSADELIAREVDEINA